MQTTGKMEFSRLKEMVFELRSRQDVIPVGPVNSYSRGYLEGYLQALNDIVDNVKEENANMDR